MIFRKFILIFCSAALVTLMATYLIATNNGSDELQAEAQAAIREFDELAHQRGVSREKLLAIAQTISDLGKRANEPAIQAQGTIRRAYSNFRSQKQVESIEPDIKKARELLADDQSIARAQFLMYSGCMSGAPVPFDLPNTEGAVVSSAITDLFEAITISQQLEDDETYIRSCILTCRALVFSNHREEAVRLAYSAVEAAEALWNPNLIRFALDRAMLAFLSNRLDFLSDRLETEGVRLARRYLELFPEGSPVVEWTLVTAGADLPRLISFQAKVDQRLDKPNKSVRENERLVEDLGMLARGFAARGEHALAYKYSLDRHSGLAPERIRKAGFKANNQPVRAVLESAQYALALNDIPAAKRHFKQLIDLGGEQTILSRPEDVFSVCNALGEYELAAKWGKIMSDRRRKTSLGNVALARKMASIGWDREMRSRQREAEALAAIERNHRRRNYVGFGTLFLFLVSGVVVVRYRTIKQSRDQLETTVEERTSEIRTALEQAELATKSKREFLARFNHEIRNPLHAIIGYVDLIQVDQDYEQDDKSAMILRGVKSSSENLMSLINDVIEVAKIEQGAYKTSKESFSLIQFASDLKNIIVPLAKEHNVEFSVDTRQCEETNVVGDESAVRQILINLVADGVKAAENGKVEVVLATSLAPEGDVSFQATVRDTGRAIPLEYHDQVFEPFVESDRNSHGKGIGLYISHSLIQWLGGDIQFESTPGNGTTFTVSLKLWRLSGKMLEHSIREVARPDLKVLVVDDKETIRDLICQQLEELGQQAKACTTVDETLSMIKTWKPNVVFLDLRMPGNSGFDFLERMKGELPEMPLTIAMTGDPTAHIKESALDAGFDVFLPKPFRSSQLNQALVLCEKDE